jgi:hypothetical protein
MMSFERTAVKRLMIFIGIDQNGQVMTQNIEPNATTKIFVVPGRLVIIEAQTPDGKVVKETPIGQFGWEYVLAEDPEDEIEHQWS